MKEPKKRSASKRVRTEPPARTSQAESDTAQVDGPEAQKQIRLRAYELYRERGGTVGDDMSDWLQAEREYLEHLRAKSVKPNPPRTTTGGWLTAPKFGSAGSGGAELEPGPERD